MTVRRLQNQKDAAYKSMLEHSKIQNKTMSELNAIKTLDNDIKQFEKKVKAQKNISRGSSSSSSEDESKNDKFQGSMKKKSIRELPKKTTN